MSNEKNLNLGTGTSKVVLIVAVLVVALFLSFYTIETGEIGVEKYFSSVTRITDEGLHFKVPFISSVDKISIRDNKIPVKIEVSSKDMQTITIEAQLIYSIPAENVQRIYATYKTDVEAILLMPTLKEKIQSGIAKYPIELFVEKRPVISNEILEAVKVSTEKSGVAIRGFLMMNHDFSKEFDKSIEGKKIAEQNAQRAAYELEQKRLEAEAQKLKQTSLTPLVLQELAIQK
jgi:regulator of protease activity HflC (stomatin/prohibitin superfamily)